MYDLAAQLNSSSRLVEILHLLNYLLRNSPSNFHAKLLCLQIYQMLGCTLGAHKIYQSLDIKHVQLDSLGYLHCAHLPTTGIYSMVKPIHDQTLKFFTASYKDSLEYLAMCYKYGSFSKLQEFMDFRERLSNSLHYSTTSVEALIQEIISFNGPFHQYFSHIQNMRIEPSEDRIKYEELMDNRDLDVMIRWDPTFKFTSADHMKYVSLVEKYKDMGTENFNQDLELLQIRSTLLRLVAYSMELIHLPRATTNGHSEESKVEDHGENFRLLLQRWQELFILANKLNRQPPSSEFLVNLLPSRLHSVLQLPYDSTISSLCELVQNLWIGSDNANKFAKSLGKAFETIRNLLSELQPTTDENGPIFYYKNLQSKIVGCVEVSYMRCLLFFVSSQTQC
jgi:N-terminal acetyltransferase B complex non-catalytic subunit